MTSHRHRHFLVFYLLIFWSGASRLLLTFKTSRPAIVVRMKASQALREEPQISLTKLNGLETPFQSFFFLAAKHISLWSPCLVHGLIINEMLKVFRCRYVFQEQN